MTRLLRSDLLTPISLPGEENSHLLTLRLSDGTVIPDGFVGRNGKVLGLLGGIDTSLLPTLYKNNFEI